MVDSNFTSAPDEDERADFAASSPKGAVKEDGQGGYSGPRSTSAPQSEIEDHREIVQTDPHVHEGHNTIVDWITGDGFNINPRSIPGTDIEQSDDDIGNLKLLLINSNFWHIFTEWVSHAGQDGHAFMEIVVEDSTFRPRLLPSERMTIKTDEFGFIEEYVLDPPGGGGPDDDGATVYEAHEVADLWFHKNPTDDFGRSWVEPISEQADILRDMEFDYARFVATKAYPPILWKLGTEEEQWSEDQIEGWLDTVEEIEPDSMLAAPHDVESDVVGVTSTSSSGGAMKLEPTFQHLQNRIVTGLGVPAILMNMGGSSGEATTTMPAFKRRIKRYQNIVKSAVEEQIFKSILQNATSKDFNGVVPEFEFGEHSSSEKRLEIDKLITLFNNGFLTREAFAERAGIDPEAELPSDEELQSQIIPTINELAGRGDNIQNPQGGSPTDSGGGAESPGGEVTSREADRDPTDDRNQKSVTEE